MRLKSTIIFLIIISLVFLGSYTAINGADIGKIKIPNAREAVELGLDLAGGVYVVLEAQTDAQGAELQKIMEQSKAVISERVDGLGVSEPNIVIEGNNRIRIELAGVKDVQEAIDMIGKTAQLKFVDPDGKEILTGKNVKGSEPQYQKMDSSGEQPVVSLEFDKEGTKKFAEATKRLAPKTEPTEKIIYIVLDDQVISNPVVNAIIDDGRAVIQGDFTIEEAGRLATLIRAGSLPVEMKEIQSSVIGPKLGLEALDKSIKAAAIAIMIIFLFMLIMYKIPGLVADIALTIYIMLVLIGMKSLGAKLTLPGIAGLILSIGMAVDANVLIFERIKEELRVGKSIRASIDAGFKRALSSVLDSNITTLIAGLVLYGFGSGPIKGFGVTLILGIIASMITSVFITKHLLKLMVNMTGAKNTKLYGA
ncbi:protein translocase subunit SecD [Anaerosalibacter bizertensis]|uniref:Protein translocase subunit SecD n=1 Tax=Anaerosalibacter bizertensis TaxID=932217 RepID=A0A9Q4AAC6_9FIRM|nr:protein translocase subunit SecD [Anaerosalibacter bizertensis]MBV1817446.1 protein translocase subunit SecD [Bacteroidales bacterium MSK.15.36]MCB5559254.1 protein translocase subunit SecD [Anaerosalibacter bizertensis]MCG4564042.1 protein translocase subunit SecD [Anaerosalibacter bizertensis]MCG4581822.1 protein translocase subunit SecD [Anaerosalibacter bizertensis]MCG4585328.1 protein translocase subunit SecD [Anaerosalibacter bizertensis]